MAKTSKRARSAKDGKFVPMKEAKKHPNTTVVETIKVGRTKKRK
jgi:hypothetical protein